MPTAANVDEKSVTINLRAPKAQRELIDRAADSVGKTRTEFMLEAARRAAEDALVDQRIFFVDQTAFDQIKDILDAPAAMNPGLAKLVARKAPWER